MNLLNKVEDNMASSIKDKTRRTQERKKVVVASVERRNGME